MSPARPSSTRRTRSARHLDRHGGVSRESGHGAAVGFGANLKPFFWIGEAEGLSGGHVHVAFAAPSRAAVDAFYRAAIAAGGKDNGPPGLRPHYHANYYGAFVLDPDGHNIEAVCHAPRSSSEAVAHQKNAQVAER